MQSTGGLINDIVIFVIFIYLVLLINGKVKLGENNQVKFDNIMERKGTLLKILVYACTAIFAILILVSIFSFTNRQVQHRRWTKADKDAMTKTCIANAKNSYQKDPVRTTALCECATEKVISKYTYEEAMKLNSKSQQEQLDSMINFESLPK
jgi:preprotein translocase subunit SecG